MFHHIKELQFDARVSGPDPRFATLLLEQFGGGNGELKAAMQYFVQAFGARQPYPDKYDLLMSIATEEFSHLEIVGATITMLLKGVNGELKDAAEAAEDAARAISGVTNSEGGSASAHRSVIALATSHGSAVQPGSCGPAPAACARTGAGTRSRPAARPADAFTGNRPARSGRR